MNQALRCRYASLLAFTEARDSAESRRIRPIRQGPSLPGQMQLPFGDDSGGSGDDGCGRQSGGRFGPRNSCQDSAGGVAATESLVQGIKDSQSQVTYSGDRVPAAFKGASEVKIGTPSSSPSSIAEVMEDVGFTLSQIAGMSPGSTENGSSVVIGGHKIPGSGKAYLQVNSEVLIDQQYHAPDLGKAKIRVDIERGVDGQPLMPSGVMSGVKFEDDVQSALHLDYFQVDNQTKNIIARSHALAKHQQQSGEGSLSPEDLEDLQKGIRAERLLGAKIMSLAVGAIEAAEKAGVDGVYTYAAGSGSGEPNIGEGTPVFRGYALWGRFGLDGEISPGSQAWSKLQQIAQTENHPDRDILTEDSWARFESGNGTLMLQDILETKKGERLWKEHGSSGNFVLNLKDKTSKGYKRYQRMKKLTARARESGQERDFFLWLADVTEFRDAEDFFKVERRSVSLRAKYASLLAFTEARDCGRQEGGKFGPKNTCAADDGGANVSGGGGGSQKQKPLDANDPEAVKAFLAQMQQELGGSRPKSLEQQRLEAAGTWGSSKTSGRNPPAPKSLEQQRLEAAGEWDAKAAEKDRKRQTKRLDTLDRHDSMDPLKDALRSVGVSWSQYGSQANDHVRQTEGITRKQFHRKAAAAALQGSESLAKFFDESGMSDLASKVRAKKNEKR